MANQTYPNTSILVIDAASAADLAPVIAEAAPDAHLRRIEENVGFGPAANEVLTAVEGASFYLFCHDDVRLEPDVVQVMVEEAFRSNAGMVGAKVVEWNDPGPHPPGGDGRRQDRGAGPVGGTRRARPGTARRGPRRVLHPGRGHPGPRRPVQGPGWLRPRDRAAGRGSGPVVARPRGRCPGAGGTRRSRGAPGGVEPAAAARRPPAPADAPPPADQSGGLHLVVTGPGHAPGRAGGPGRVRVRRHHRALPPRGRRGGGLGLERAPPGLDTSPSPSAGRPPPGGGP